MDYLFCLPNCIKVSDEITAFSGGWCQSDTRIYLFGRVNEDNWIDIIQHEHLHVILFRNHIIGSLHHPIIDELEVALSLGDSALASDAELKK